MEFCFSCSLRLENEIPVERAASLIGVPSTTRWNALVITVLSTNHLHLQIVYVC